jgi:hypothetical protein
MWAGDLKSAITQFVYYEAVLERVIKKNAGWGRVNQRSQEEKNPRTTNHISEKMGTRAAAFSAKIKSLRELQAKVKKIDF